MNIKKIINDIKEQLGLFARDFGEMIHEAHEMVKTMEDSVFGVSAVNEELLRFKDWSLQSLRRIFKRT